MANDLTDKIRAQFPEITVIMKGDEFGFLYAKDIDEIDQNGGADDVVLCFSDYLRHTIFDSTPKERVVSFVKSIRPTAKRVLFYYE